MALMFILQWAASLFLIGVVHKFSVDERRAELGIMKALGATDGNIRSLLTLEVVICPEPPASRGSPRDCS